jgi:hypothetical protein
MSGLPSRVDLVPIPAGAIAARDARTGSTQDVVLLPFEIGRTSITAEFYGELFGAAEDTPAHAVTWFDAVNWCNRVSSAAGRLRAAPQMRYWGSVATASISTRAPGRAGAMASTVTAVR